MVLIRTISRVCVCAISLVHIAHCSSSEDSSDDSIIISPDVPFEILKKDIVDWIDAAHSDFKKWGHSKFIDTLLDEREENLENHMANFIADIGILKFVMAMFKEYGIGSNKLVHGLNDILGSSSDDETIVSSTRAAMASYYDCLTRMLKKAMIKNSIELCDFSFPEFDGVVSCDYEYKGPIRAQFGVELIQTDVGEARLFSPCLRGFVDPIIQWYRKRDENVDKMAREIEDLELKLVDACEVEYPQDIEGFEAILQELVLLRERVAALEAGRGPHASEPQGSPAAECMDTVEKMGRMHPDIPVMRRSSLKMEISKLRTEILKIITSKNLRITEHPDIYKPLQEKLDELFDSDITLTTRVLGQGRSSSDDDMYKAERAYNQSKLVQLLRQHMLDFIFHLKKRSKSTSNGKKLVTRDVAWCKKHILTIQDTLVNTLINLGTTCTSEMRNCPDLQKSDSDETEAESRSGQALDAGEAVVESCSRLDLRVEN